MSGSAEVPSLERGSTVGTNTARIENPVLAYPEIGVEGRFSNDIVAPVVGRQDLEDEVRCLAFLPVLVRLPRATRRSKCDEDVRGDRRAPIAFFEKQKLVGGGVDVPAGEPSLQGASRVAQHVTVEVAFRHWPGVAERVTVFVTLDRRDRSVQRMGMDRGECPPHSRCRVPWGVGRRGSPLHHRNVPQCALRRRRFVEDPPQRAGTVSDIDRTGCATSTLTRRIRLRCHRS